MVKKHRGFILLFILALALFFNRVIFTGSALLTGDNLVQAYPWLSVYSGSLKMFRMPFWARGIHCGFPLIAEGQVGGFYPLNALIFFLFPFKAAYNGMLVFHFLAAGICTYLFARKIGADEWGGAIAAFVFCFGSAFANSGYHLGMIRALAWFPLVLLLFEYYLERPRPGYILIASAVAGFQLLSGSVQMAFYSMFFYLVYFLYRAGSRGRRVVPSAGVFAFFTLVSVLIFLPQYLLTMQAVQNSGRLASLGFALWGSLNPASVLTSVFPCLLSFKGHINTEDLFLGTLALLFLISSFGMVRRHREVRPLLLMLVLSILLSLGLFNPLYVLVLKLTGFYTFRAPSRFIFFGIFSASVLVGVGFSHFFRRETMFNIRTMRVFSGYVLACAAAVFGMRWLLLSFRPWMLQSGKWFIDRCIVDSPYHRYDAARYYDKLEAMYNSVLGNISPDNRYMLISLGFVVLSVLFCLFITYYSRRTFLKRYLRVTRSIAAVVIVSNLFVYAYFPVGLESNLRKFTSVEPDTSPVFGYLKKDEGLFRILPFDIRSGRLPLWAVPNVNMRFGIDSAGAYSPLAGGDYRDLLKRFQAVDDSVGVLSPDASMLEGADLDSLRLLNVKYIISPEKIDMRGLTEVMNGEGIRLYRLSGSLGRGYLVKDMSGPPVLIHDEPEVIRYRPGYAEFGIKTDGDAYLVFSESWFPGWKARIDGEEVAIEKFRGILQAVKVTKGRHRVVFSYAPDFS